MKRRLFASTALVTGLAVAACSVPGQTPNAVEAGIQRAIAIAQGILNYAGPVLPMLAAFVPGAAPFVPIAMAGIGVASGLLNTLSTKMAAADAQPIIGKVTTAIQGVLDAGDQATALVSNPTQKAQATAILAAARGELALLAQLATNIQSVVATPPAPAAGIVAPRYVVPPIFTRAAG